MVRMIADMDEWNALMEISKSKAVIVDFTATWCVSFWEILRD